MARHPEARYPYRQPKGTGPNGRPLCRWCWGEVAPRRSSWCGDQCVREYREEHDWNHIRDLVEKRDRGICASCGVDSIKRQRVVFRWLMRRHRIGNVSLWRSGASWVTPEQARIGEAVWNLVGRNTARKCPWEADHIVARADGGRDHPDNLRTLCVPCHRKRTAEQTRERRRKGVA